MGEAPAPDNEYILALLPFEKTEDVTRVLDSVRAKHPHVEIEYHNINFTPGIAADTSHIPEGLSPCQPHSSILY